MKSTEVRVSVGQFKPNLRVWDLRPPVMKIWNWNLTRGSDQPAEGDPDAALPYCQYPGHSLREMDNGQGLTVAERFDRNVGELRGLMFPLS